MEKIIEIENIGKTYPLFHNRNAFRTLRDNVADFVKHPFRRKSVCETFWALKNVNLSIDRGDVIGIIGKNGAGKSTLLKILAGITKPTEGKIVLRGKVSSLLEVGTGFHPELTGRENIYLNGVILGMTRKEISEKFDQIVEFAGISKFLDTPVKHYSSGMHIRLAFSVAAHLEPDILIVDEVLAVGDVEFQKKCLGKMQDISNKKERTVILVSHDLNAIQAICKNAVLIDHGEIIFIGPAAQAVEKYIGSMKDDSLNGKLRCSQNTGHVDILKISMKSDDGILTNQIKFDSKAMIEVRFRVKEALSSALVSFIFRRDGHVIYVVSDRDESSELTTYNPGTYETLLDLPPNLFNPGYYSLEINIQTPGRTCYAVFEDYVFSIENTPQCKTRLYGGRVYGHFGLNSNVKTKQI